MDYNKLYKNAQEIIDANKSDARFSFSLVPVNISSESAGYAEKLCHPILGNHLIFNWQLGREKDTIAIEAALSSCAYTGMAVQAFENKGAFNTEEVFCHLGKDGLGGWEINCLLECDISQPELKKQIDDFFEKCAQTALKRLPKHVASEDTEMKCVEACVVMFFIGKSINFKGGAALGHG